MMTWPRWSRYLFSAWALAWMVLWTAPMSTLCLVMGYVGFAPQQVHRAAVVWATVLLYGIGCRVKLIGGEELEPGRPYVFAANHSSALDILALMAVLPDNFRWMAKKELLKVPVFGPAMGKAGYIFVDRSDRRAAAKSLSMAARRIADGASVVIFPEGTRSRDGKLARFRSGGLSLAIKAEVPVVPVAIVGTRQSLPAGSLLLAPGRLEVIMGRPLSTQGLKLGDRDDLANLTREKVAALLEDATGEQHPPA